jgi:acetylornithine deacetylase
MNIAALDGGMAFNIIPARAALTFSMRPAPGVDLAPFLTGARRGPHRRGAAGLWIGSPSRPIPHSRPATFIASCRSSATERKARWTLPFGTEAGQFVEQGIDAVVLGPGRMEQAHKADEYVDLDELEEAVRVFLQVIR